MKKKLTALFLALVICIGTAAQVKANAAVPTAAEQQAYQAMIALKEQYPEGMPWTNDNYYGWKGGIFSGGYGCAGFAFLLSDAAFGDAPARKLTEFSFSSVRVGDILRINNNTHSVIVLEVRDSSVVIAEGNYNSSIHWGRVLSAAQVQSASYLMTRYPEPTPTPTPEPEPTPTPTPEPEPIPTPTPEPEPIPTPTPEPEPIPAPSFTDVKTGDWFAEPVQWAVSKDITNGTNAARTEFSPGRNCTHIQILTFLSRAAGVTSTALDWDEEQKQVQNWARETGMIGSAFNGGASCTRAEAVNYIWQALGKESAKAGSFTDVNPNAGYARAVDWAVANGVTNGTNKAQTEFSPNKVCDRGTIVTFLHRAYVPSARLPV